MTGPEHYHRAEELLGGRHNGGANGAKTPEEAMALAQIHATLALAAATIDAQRGGVEVWSEWPAATEETR